MLNLIEMVKNINNKALTHYVVKDEMVIQHIPDDNISEAVNGGRLNKFGYLHGICNKYNSISIGIISGMSSSGKKTCLNLIMTLKQRYKIDNDNIVRQMDVTGDIDPECWHDSKLWQAEIINNLIEI